MSAVSDRITVWRAVGSVAANPQLIQHATPLEPTDPPPGELAAAVIAPCRDGRGHLAAALLVRGSCTTEFRCGGDLVRADRGSVALRIVSHGTCLELSSPLDRTSRQKLWISTDRAVEEVDYDPEVDGEDLYCFRTKARLKLGDRIVLCPGHAPTSCAMIYKASAWHTGLPCHQCGRRPDQAGWTPPMQHEGSSLDVLLQLLEE